MYKILVNSIVLFNFNHIASESGGIGTNPPRETIVLCCTNSPWETKVLLSTIYAPLNCSYAVHMPFLFLFSFSQYNPLIQLLSCSHSSPRMPCVFKVSYNTSCFFRVARTNPRFDIIYCSIQPAYVTIA